MRWVSVYLLRMVKEQRRIPLFCVMEASHLSRIANAGAACQKLDRFQASLEPKITGASQAQQPCRRALGLSTYARPALC